MKAAVSCTLNSLGRKSRILQVKDNLVSRDYAREDLPCVVAVKVTYLEFEGQTKTGPGHLEVQRIFEQAFQELATEYLKQYPNTLEGISSKALQTFRVAMASKKARVLVRRKNVLKSCMLPGKESV